VFAGAAVLVAAGLGVAAGPPQSSSSSTSSRIVAIGDIHGDADAFVAILKRTGLIDERRQWSGGTATLVQTGDFTDRGAKVREVMDLLMALEEQAAEARGRVVTLLGNHEMMNLLGETRDATPEIFATFADDQSETRREEGYQAYTKLVASRSAALSTLPQAYKQSREAWMAAHPPGFIEYREAFGPQARYGRWLRTRPVVAEIDGTIFMHAGIDPAAAPRKLSDINDRARNEIKQFDGLQKRLAERGLILPWFTLAEIIEASRAELEAAAVIISASRTYSDTGVNGSGQADTSHVSMLQDLLKIGSWSIVTPNGPLWFRGFAEWPAADGARHIEGLLKRYKAERFAVGHTVPSTMKITLRFSSRVFLLDTGMLSSRYKGGQPSALEIRNGRYRAVYLTETEDLEGSSRDDELALGRPR
jgi:hypothetical protein